MAADAENTPELFSGNVSLVNASLTYSAPGDDWSLAIGGNNVFNKRYIANGVNQLNGAGLLSAVPNRPSEYYATLRRSEEQTSELQSLMRTSYAVFCLKKKNQ